MFQFRFQILSVRLSSGDGSRVVMSPIGGSRAGVLPDDISRESPSSKRQILGGGVPGGGLRAGATGSESDASSSRPAKASAEGRSFSPDLSRFLVLTLAPHGDSGDLRGGSLLRWFAASRASVTLNR